MGRLVGAGSRIVAPRGRMVAAPKRVEPFYQSPAWRAKVAEIKARRGAWCERCGSRNRVVLDHVRERRDGGADLDDANLELLCAGCHAKKTAQARARRARGEAG